MDVVAGRDSVAGLLRQQALAAPDAIAIAAPGEDPLTYGDLFEQVTRAVASLNGMGIGRNDRVAVVLPNGPGMATAFLGIAAGATFAPLNPAYTFDEFEFYLRDLGASALILGAGAESPAREVARKHGIPVVDRVPVSGAAGTFELVGPARPPSASPGFAEPADTALVLHTSGTTSRPKIVPLSGRNLCSTADAVRATLRLTASDCCLSVMPLFHIHGLVGATLSSVAAGARVFCTSGFMAPEFFGWLEASGATWYTAVPTMHQAVLARAGSHADTIRRLRLRFIRSSSAALPTPVIEQLETTFGVPVIEAYGMTENAHQMACNPLPPRVRKPGSVGLPSGPEIAILADSGGFAGPGEVGEILIRGPSVTAGYENNPDANAAAFTNGWFRTGDQGFLDEDGYLFITGRLKEIINRGGEKISPREVDDVLLAHGGVAQAVTFAVPHPSLGEDVAAAVVAREGTQVTASELRAFAADRLAHFKVPRRILFLPEIPKGSTGKVQRVGLAERLGMTAAGLDAAAADTPYVAPRSETELLLAGIWAEVLDVERVGANDDFFLLGGDSMLAMRIAARIQDRLGVELPLPVLFESPTLAAVAAVIDGGASGSSAEDPSRADDGV